MSQTQICTKVAVNTPFGPTERIEVDKLVEQGGSWGPILCSNSIDTIGKKATNKYQAIYK